MSKESRYGLDKHEIFRFTGNDEFNCRKKGWKINGSPTFSNGVCTFTSADSDYIDLGNVRKVHTVNIKVKLNTTTEDIIDFDGTIKLIATAGTLSVSNLGDEIIYVGGAVNSVIGTGWVTISFTTVTGINASALKIGNGLDGQIDVLTGYSKVWTPEDVALDYKNALYRDNKIGLIGHWSLSRGDEVAGNTNLITNGDFSSWAGVADPNNYPIGWLLGASDVLNFVQDAGGKCRFVSDSGNVYLIKGGAVTTGKRYKYSITVTDFVTGVVRLTNASATYASFNSAGTFTGEFTALNGTLALERTGATDLTFTNLQIYEIQQSDLSGNGNNGSLYPGASEGYVTDHLGRVGYAYDFAGDTKIEFGDVGTVKSFSFWLNADVAASREIVDVDGTYKIEIDASGDIVATSFPDATIYVDGEVGTRIRVGKDHFIVVTDNIGVDASALVLGYAGVSYFDGKLSEFRSSSRVLSPVEIRYLHNLQRGWK